ncbi:hypothetical protein L1887_50171 [Cichorium endivia]|nr:hypothetical protein L1887_50171 [Cichorium endivia]
MGFAPERVDWGPIRHQERRTPAGTRPPRSQPDSPVPTDYKSASAAALTSSGAGGHDYDEEDEAALADLVSKKGQQAADRRRQQCRRSQVHQVLRLRQDFQVARLRPVPRRKVGSHVVRREHRRDQAAHRRGEEGQARGAACQARGQARCPEQDRRRGVARQRKIRRKAGQDLTEVKEEMKRKEQLKEAERKRKEKADDAAFKAKIKAQIEADKRERAAKAARR